MPKSNLPLLLGKVLVTVAWADGELSHDELNSLKDALFQLPDISDRDWRVLEMYMDHPVKPVEREALVAELVRSLRSRADRELAIRALESLASADGTIGPREEMALEEIRDHIGESAGLLGGLRRLMKPRGQQSTREDDFEDFVRNRVFYRVRRRFPLEENAGIDIPEGKLRKLCLAGALMSLVAHSDEEIAEQEADVMSRAMKLHWGLGETEAAVVVEIALSDAVKGSYRSTLTRRFYDLTNREERLEMLEALFAVAVSHGGAAHSEVEMIRNISNAIKCTHSDFIHAKVKYIS